MNPDADVTWAWKAISAVLGFFGLVFGGAISHLLGRVAAHEQAISAMSRTIDDGDSAAGRFARAEDDKLWAELRRISDQFNHHQNDIQSTLRGMAEKIGSLPTRADLAAAMVRQKGS